MTKRILSWLKMSASALLVVGVPLLVRLGAAANDDPPKTARYYRQQAAAAYRAKDYAAAIENFKKAAEIIPDHPTLFYNLACVYALAGRKEDALSSLTKVAEMGLIMPAEKDGDLDSIKDTPAFKLILKQFEASKTPVIKSSTAFTIHEKGLITEGLAYDPVEETFFVSSVHKRKILSVRQTGEAKTFASEQDGLFSVLGMSVDAKRRHLWVTSTAFPQMLNFKKEEDGTSAVFKFDLVTKKLVKKYVLSNATKKHALGDLTIQSNGDVFTTDSLQIVQEGKVDLDAKIERWFGIDAWFPRLPNAKDITLRMLMNHSSGIPEHVLNKDFIAEMKKDPDRIWKPEELVAYILDAKPLFAAGNGWSYADTNYILAGMIFERVTKKTVYGEVERRILKPLKLARTIPSDRRALPEVITGYSMVNSTFGFEGRVILDGKFIINPQMEWTGSGFASTAEDLARWAKLLYEGKVLKKEALDQMLNGVDAKEGRGSGAGNKYGLAVQIRPSEWGVSYGHGGWFPGYLSEMEYFPRHRMAVAVQFNTDASRTLQKGPRAYIADAMRIIVAEIEKKKAA